MALRLENLLNVDTDHNLENLQELVATEISLALIVDQIEQKSNLKDYI